MKIVLSDFYMRHNTTLIILLLLVFRAAATAQGVDDALFNAPVYLEGTGRSVAMGNATGALGGDVTATYINPAGIGLYRTSEMTFTTGIQHTLFSSTNYGESHLGGKTRISIPNFGYVLTMPCSNYKHLRFLQFGIALTRTNDFNYRSNAKGLNPSSSMVDAYLQTIDGIDELFDPGLNNPGEILSSDYPYDLNLAWQTCLIDRFVDSLGCYFNSPIPQGNLVQQDNVKSKGRSEEWTMSIGANIHEKLFIGSSLGMAHLKRISTRVYTETPGDPESTSNLFTEWSHQEDLSDAAWGVNFKCGFLYYPSRWIRFGASWQSKTLFTFDEEWSTFTESNLIRHHDVDYHKYLSPTLYYNYNFASPHRFTGSMAVFCGQRGLITLDVDYLNYGQSRLSSDEYNYTDVNTEISEILRPSWNFRLGTEWRLRQFFFRGGMAYYGSYFGFGQPYGSVKKLALGVGYATQDDTSWDFAYELTESTTAYTPYQFYVDGENIVNAILQRRWRNKLFVTLKVKIE